ncbi:Orotidine 5'-phosphate decarboxylase [Desulfonema limicola]|uniref:Orotidine 5'-phosphate decarboxylase n=1 Tax=Desulfonema limicola TaxID=45656 RepID=A0A975GJ02_9BACT|nr:orotidine-5'-phosphate decarboxylase [Desulfonema limicola]QTA82468.1 Orotidine 5'-phosphate decarboxylase [Desulfonema limicola]
MKQAKDYIIFPLDLPSVKQAEEYISLLSGHVGMFKVGLELFIQAGPGIINIIKNAGDTGIFLDLKLHDIPETVYRAMKRIAELGVDFATVHCSESRKMLEAAVKGADGKTGVLGVTVLTSVSAHDIETAGFKQDFYSDIQTLVMKRAEAAKAAGCAGIVCSGLEVEPVKQRFGRNFAAITPGIRPGWDIKKDDQQRITTPAQAVQKGADYIVIGRPIRDADDPVKAAVKIAEEIQAVL